MPTKHCILDPLHTWLTKECMEEMLLITTEKINVSRSIGEMEKALKHAIIKPLLKEIGLDLIKEHYRPVSNLAFLGKLIESAVIMQLIEHTMTIIFRTTDNQPIRNTIVPRHS